jgi:transcriptional regulator with XRE-family HTH domain
MTLRELREAKAFTQTELAAAVGVTAQAVYSWERGEYEPALFKIRGIAQFLGVTVDEVRNAIRESAIKKQ